MRMLSCQEGRIYMKVPLPVYVLCMTPTCQLVHMVCACVWCGAMYVCFRLLTCVHIPLFNIFKCVWGCLWVLCMRVCVIFVHLLHIWASLCLFKCMCVHLCVVWQRKTKDSQRKPDPTRTQQSVWCGFSDLARCVDIHPVQSLATAAWGNIELKHTFHMMAFVK